MSVMLSDAACFADEAELIDALDRASRDQQRVLPVGLGSKLAWCRPEIHENVIPLSTRAMNEVVAYEPGDGTLTAQAGCTMEKLAQTVAGGGHRLTPDVPNPKTSTLGGVLGASFSGPDRLRYGPLRYHVLGMRVALADGTIARSGGRLVKNVTGFDLHRLYCGSRGTLCVILEASLRLFPAPALELALTKNVVDLRTAFELAEKLRALPVKPHAITIETRSGPTERLHVFLAGGASEIAAERDLVLAVLGDAEERVDNQARKHRTEVRDLGADAQLRLTCLPTRAGDAIDTQRTFWASKGIEPVYVAQPGIAGIDLFLPDRAKSDAASLAASALDLRERLFPAEARLHPLSVPLEVHEALARSAGAGELDVAWMLRLRAMLDPKGLFASPLFPVRK